MRVFAGVPFDTLQQDQLLARLTARDPRDPFAYLVTPNVDHVVRLHAAANNADDPLARAYRDAHWRACDSRILARLAGLRGVALPVSPGSDVTAALFAGLTAGDRIVIVGGNYAMLETLRTRYPGTDIRQHVPPMGMKDDEDALAAAVAFVEANPARFVFLAVGSPQQEMLAQRIHACGKASGIGLCVGASIDFLTGATARAPLWIQRASLEWLHRLVGNPRRLWRRYLVEGPRIFSIALGEQQLLPTFRTMAALQNDDRTAVRTVRGATD